MRDTATHPQDKENERSLTEWRRLRSTILVIDQSLSLLLSASLMLQHVFRPSLPSPPLVTVSPSHTHPISSCLLHSRLTSGPLKAPNPSMTMLHLVSMAVCSHSTVYRKISSLARLVLLSFPQSSVIPKYLHPQRGASIPSLRKARSISRLFRNGILCWTNNA